MGSLQLYLYTQKDIFLYKIFPLLDGRDGAHLSGTCTFMRKLIRDLAEKHLLSKRMKNHVIYLKNVNNFPQISNEYSRKRSDFDLDWDTFKYFDTLPGQDATTLYHELTNKWLFVNNFYSEHCNFDNAFWDSLTRRFIQKGYKWKLIHYPPAIGLNYCVFNDSRKIYMHRGFCIWLEVPREKIKKQKI